MDDIAKGITHEEYIKMYSTVRGCLEWSVKLRDVLGVHFTRFNNVDVPKDFLKEMREAARTEGTQKHIDVLNEVFGKEAPTPKFKVGDWVRTTEFTRVCRVENITPRGYKLRGLHGAGFIVGERDIKPWIPEVGEWVVARGEDEAVQVTSFEYDIVTTRSNSHPFNSYYVIEHLRPATNEEVEKAKGEDMFFTKAGVESLANLIANPDYCRGSNLARISGLYTAEKAQWINKTITKALKDEGLW